jgi:hypothetical protein
MNFSPIRPKRSKIVTEKKKKHKEKKCTPPAIPPTEVGLIVLCSGFRNLYQKVETQK